MNSFRNTINFFFLPIYFFYLIEKKSIKFSIMKEIIFSDKNFWEKKIMNMESFKFFINLYGSPKVLYSDLLLCYYNGFDEFFKKEYIYICI